MLIAIAGGIGSGKTSVTKVFCDAGVRAISADEINSELLKSPEYIKKLAELFPFAVENGTVNRRKLRDAVFHSECERQKLNALAHPEIMAEIARRTARFNGMAVVEVPLLLEAGELDQYDHVVVVTAPMAERIRRVALRDKVEKSYAKQVAECQATEKALLPFATDIIENNGTLEELQEKARELYKKLKEKSDDRASNTTLRHK